MIGKHKWAASARHRQPLDDFGNRTPLQVATPWSLRRAVKGNRTRGKTRQITGLQRRPSASDKPLRKPHLPAGREEAAGAALQARSRPVQAGDRARHALRQIISKAVVSAQVIDISSVAGLNGPDIGFATSLPPIGRRKRPRRRSSRRSRFRGHGLPERDAHSAGEAFVSNVTRSWSLVWVSNDGSALRGARCTACVSQHTAAGCPRSRLAR